MELRAKSTALFDLAARLGDTRDPGEPVQPIYTPLYVSTCFLAIENQCPMYTPAIASLQKLLSGFIKRLPSFEANRFSLSTFVEYTLFTTHSMAHASVIRLLYFSASKALDYGLLDGVSRTIITSGSVREHESLKALIDVFSAYESFDSEQQVDFSRADASQRMLEPVPDDEDAVKAAVDTGRLIACQDKCLTAARAIVKIVQQVNEDQYSYLEPVISVRVDLCFSLLLPLAYSLIILLLVIALLVSWSESFLAGVEAPVFALRAVPLVLTTSARTTAS